MNYLSEIYINKNEFLKTWNKRSRLSIKTFRRVLVLAPHCDDEVIGCAGTLLKLLTYGAEVKIVYLTTEGGRMGEIRKEEALEVWKKFNIQQEFWDFEDGKLNLSLIESKIKLKNLVDIFAPDVIMAPWMIDLHVDYCTVFEMIQNLENCTICYYENYYPLIANCTVDITTFFDKKIEMLKIYKSQKRLGIERFTRYLNSYRAACFNLKKVKYVEAFHVV